MKKILFAFLLIPFVANATTYGDADFTCSACGTKDAYTVLTSTNQLEPSSLDTRPGEMRRSASIRMMHKCKTCGFVSYDIEKKICDKQNEIVKSEIYQNILNAKTINEFSKRYQAYAYLLEQCDKEKHNIIMAYLRAAWAADDALETDNAIDFRKKVISYLEQGADVIDEQIILLDLYRRTSQFQKGLALIPNIKVNENDENACMYTGLINHEKELLIAEDTADQRMKINEYCPQK